MSALRVVFWPTPADEEIAVRTILGEIRGGSLIQMANVAWVLRNRLEDDRGRWAKDDTLATVCLRDLQFSCWTRSDPNFGVIHSAGPHQAIYRQARAALLEVLEADSETDPTHGSKHYFAKAMQTSYLPEWAWRSPLREVPRDPVLDDGKHLFFNDVP